MPNPSKLSNEQTALIMTIVKLLQEPKPKNGLTPNHVRDVYDDAVIYAQRPEQQGTRS